MLINTEPQDKTFAITLCVRDTRTGLPTGKTKTYESDSGDELYSRFIAHVGTQQKKKRKKQSSDVN